jgi:hypothetical protein
MLGTHRRINNWNELAAVVTTQMQIGND